MIADPQPAPPGDRTAWADALEQRFHLLYDPEEPENFRTPEGFAFVEAFLAALESAQIVSVENVDGEWIVSSWVRQALMQCALASHVTAQDGPLPGNEMDLLSWNGSRPQDRRTAAGSLLRRGAYLAPGCVVMPPSVIQAGACVMEGVLIDAHVLIGNCARLEPGVRVGCGTMIGGFLTPIDLPAVVLERNVVVGGNCGIYGSVIVGEGSKLHPGTVLHSPSGAYDSRSQTWLLPGQDAPLRIPANTHVAMGLPPLPPSSDGVPRLYPVLGSLRS